MLISVSSVSTSIGLLYIFFCFIAVNLNIFTTKIVSPTEIQRKWKNLYVYRKRRYWLGHYFYFFSTDKNFADTLEEIGRQVETVGENTMPRKEDKAKEKKDKEIDT